MKLLKKKDKAWEELCAKFDEYKEKAKDRDQWKRKFDELQIASKEEEIKHLKELVTGSNLTREEYGTVMSSEANENGLELLNKISWKVALQKYFDETMGTPSSVMEYIANPCVRTDLQVKLVCVLLG